MRIVRCNMCGEWIGWEVELKQIQTSRANKFGENDVIETCPSCGASDALMDVDDGSIFSEIELKKLWELFAEIPITDADEIEEEYLGFPAGTNRFDVWHWFDEHWPRGVYNLAYEGGCDEN